MIQFEYLAKANRDEIIKYNDNVEFLNDLNRSNTSIITVSVVLFFISLGGYYLPKILSLNIKNAETFMMIYACGLIGIGTILAVVRTALIYDIKNIYNKSIIKDAEKISSNLTTIEVDFEKHVSNELHEKSVEVEKKYNLYKFPFKILKFLTIFTLLLGGLFLCVFIVSEFINLKSTFLDQLNIFKINLD